MKTVSIGYIYETTSAGIDAPSRWKGVLEFQLEEVDADAVRVEASETNGRKISQHQWVSYGDRFLVTVQDVAGMMATSPDFDPTSMAAMYVLIGRGMSGINTGDFRRRGRPAPGSFLRSNEDGIVESIRAAMEGSIVAGGILRMPSGEPCWTIALDGDSTVSLGAAGCLNPNRRHMVFALGETQQLEEWKAVMGAAQDAGVRVDTSGSTLFSEDFSRTRMDEAASRTLEAAGPHLFRLTADSLAAYARLRDWTKIPPEGRSEMDIAGASTDMRSLIVTLADQKLLSGRELLLVPAVIGTCDAAYAATGVEATPEEDGEAYSFSL